MSKGFVELEIEDHAFDGKSVARLDGKVVFLNGGLPGERVLAEIVRSKPRYNQAVVHGILRKSDSRIPAVCAHFDVCGGCTWQDLKYDQQLAFKKNQVVESIARIGGLDNVAVREVTPSAEVFRYRNKMEFSFHTAGTGGFSLGLHHRGRFDDIFNLDACHLQSEAANGIVRWTREFVSETGIPVYDVLKHEGYLRFLIVREAKRTGQIMVCLVTNFGELPHCDRLVEGLKRVCPQIATIVHGENGGKSNIATAEKETVLFGPGYIEERLFNCTFRISAGTFFQTNSLQAETLYQTGFDLLDAQATDRVLDLYCGTGSIGILLASRVREVVGVEVVSDSIRRAKENAALNGIDNITFVEAQAEDFLKDVCARGNRYDAAIVDPPRAGLHPKALKRILELAPPKLLYVSCNPATFARDAAGIVAAGYSVLSVQPVDMFPHTKHIEVVARFSR
jgi:23S rRNA (uracil1939-C5)-methyltransferase